MLAFDRHLANIKPVNDYFLKGLETFKNQYLSTQDEGFILKWEKGEERDLFLFPVLNEFGFNQDQVSNIKNSVSFPGKYFNSNTHRLTIDRDCILIRKTEDEQRPQIQEFEIPETTKSISDPIELQFSISENTTILKNVFIGQFDFDKLNFPLILRKWKPGDKMEPLGLGGEKRISDILIDKKIPLPDKSKVYILENKGEIVWLIGIVIGDKFKISDTTKRVWSAELKV